MDRNKDKKQLGNGSDSMNKDKNQYMNHIEKDADIDYVLEHLKDHLNTSFDQDSIVVSEDLIQKTLGAIAAGKEPITSQDHVLDDMNMDHTKYMDMDTDMDIDLEEDNTHLERKPKYSIFKLASIAAVLLILLVGINLLQHLGMGSKKQMDIEKEDSVLLYGEAESDRKTESITALEAPVKEEASDKKRSDYQIAAEDTALATETKENSMAGLLFSDIFPFTQDEVTTMTITNNSGETVTTTELEKIKSMFVLLDYFPLLLIENHEDEWESQWEYQIRFETLDVETYTIFVGHDIQVMTGDNKNDIIRYSSTERLEQLKISLEEFMSE